MFENFSEITGIQNKAKHGGILDNVVELILENQDWKHLFQHIGKYSWISVKVKHV